jgi:hypothetical protein
MVALTASWLGQLFTFPAQAQLGNFAGTVPKSNTKKSCSNKPVTCNNAAIKPSRQLKQLSNIFFAICPLQ